MFTSSFINIAQRTTLLAAIASAATALVIGTVVVVTVPTVGPATLNDRLDIAIVLLCGAAVALALPLLPSMASAHADLLNRLATEL